MTDEERLARVRSRYIKPVVNADIRHPSRRRERHERRAAAQRARLMDEARLDEKRRRIEESRKEKYRQVLEQRASRVSRDVVRIEHRRIHHGEWLGVLSALGYESYAAYLASKLWEKIRTRVMWEQRRTCQYCGGVATEVHHERYTYENLAGLDLEYLKAACRACHREQHGIAAD